MQDDRSACNLSRGETRKLCEMLINVKCYQYDAYFAKMTDKLLKCYFGKAYDLDLLLQQ